MPSNPDARSGFIAAVAAYVLWGFLPLYFEAVHTVPPLVILSQRILWSVPTAFVLILAGGKGREALGVFLQPKVLLALGASSIAIAANWTIYIWAVTSGHVLAGSLGYYINPLITFLIAALLFGERFSRWQFAALGLATLGVVNQAVVVGEFPWVSLSLAVSFAIYSAIRKRVAVDARVGFAIEVAWLAPFALAYLAFFLPAGVSAFGKGDVGSVLMLGIAGPLTATPLILFGFGARRLRLSTIAVLQYIAPTIQFGIGLAAGEPFTPAHLLTFALIWSGVAIFTLAAWRADQAARAALASAGPVPAK